MMFVPIVPSAGCSPRAQELARELEATVERYRAQHPDMSAFEVRSALRLTRQRTGSAARVQLVVAAAAIALALGVALQAFQRHVPPEAAPGGAPGTTWMIPTVAVAVLLLGVLALVIARR